MAGGGATLSISNCSIQNNTSYSGGGFFNATTDSVLKITNCSIANNTSTYGGAIHNVGSLTVGDSRIYSNSVNTDALLPGSPAIDAGETPNCTDSLGAPITVDQRGFPRPADGGISLRCDIGAYELYRFAMFLPTVTR